MTGVRNLAKKDWSRLLPSSFDKLDLEFEAPNGETATIQGWGVRVSIPIQTDGQEMYGELARITFSESTLSTENSNYPIRDAQGLVAMNEHVVAFLDAQNVKRFYKLKVVQNDNTVGVISADCQDFKPST